MKAFASTLVLLLISALLGGWWWWREREMPLPPGVQNLVRLEPETVQKIVLINENPNKTLKFNRNASGWELASVQMPRAVSADNEKVQQWLSQFVNVNSDAVYVDDAAKRARFGLTKPKSSFEIAGEQTLKIEWGDRAPFAPPRLYARIQSAGKSQIALLPLSLRQSMNKSLETWRDRRLLGFEVEKVASIDLRAPQIEAAFAKNSSRWQLLNPLREEADTGNISALLNSLSAARVVRWPQNSQRATQFKSKPLAVVKLQGDGTQQLIIQSRVGDGFLARRRHSAGENSLAEDEIFVVSSDVFAAMNKPLLAWRSKVVFDFTVDDVARATILARNRVVIYERDGAKWRQIAPANDLQNRGNAVWELLLPLRDWRAQNFAGQWPASKPALEVRVMENGVECRLQVVAQNNRVLARAWRGAVQSSPIWVLAPDSLSRLSGALNALFSTSATPKFSSQKP